MIHLYSAFCVLLYTQSALQSCGGSLLNHHQCAASTWMMRRLLQDNGTSALTTHQLQVERRERERANQVDGDYYEAMIDKGQWWEFGQDTGVTPYSLREVPWDFNDHRESGPRFNVSSERRMSYSSRRPHRVPLLSAKNRKRRLQFAQAHQNWTIEDWKNVAWSEVSRFLLRDTDGRVRIWRKEHESVDPSCLVSTVQTGGGGVMVWVGMQRLTGFTINCALKCHG